MQSQSKRGDSTELFSGILKSSDDVRFVNLSKSELQTLIEVLSDELPSETNTAVTGSDLASKNIVVLNDKETFRSVQDEFTIASALTQLVTDNLITLHKTDTDLQNIIVTPGKIYSLIPLPDEVISVSKTTEEDIQRLQSFADEHETGETPRLKYPSISEIRERLDEELGDSYVNSFDKIVEEMTDTEKEPDIADVFVMLSAYEGELQKEVAKLLGDVGVNSIATISRCKTDLENKNLITKNAVRKEVGRPMHKLQLTENAQSEIQSVADIIPVIKNNQ